MKMQGKVAVVTGGARGIGKAIIGRYASEGATCAVADKDLEGARKTAAEIKSSGGKAFAVALDVTSRQGIQEMVDTVVSTAGRIDVLVNNAGVVEIQPIFEITEQSWDRVFDVNVKGLFFTLQTVAKRMVDQNQGGKIINLASEAGQRSDALVVAYGATKAAVIHLTRTAAIALIPYKINVNAISPGVVDTPMWVGVDQMLASGWGSRSGR